MSYNGHKRAEKQQQRAQKTGRNGRKRLHFFERTCTVRYGPVRYGTVQYGPGGGGAMKKKKTNRFGTGAVRFGRIVRYRLLGAVRVPQTAMVAAGYDPERGGHTVSSFNFTYSGEAGVASWRPGGDHLCQPQGKGFRHSAEIW